MESKKTDQLNRGIIVYPISANPPTWGHADIMMRASLMFDTVYWAVAKNTRKDVMLTGDTRSEMMKIYVDHYRLENVIVDQIEGPTVRYAQEKKAGLILRGLRSSSDFQAELELATGNRGIDKNIETICMFSKPHYATISSSIVRELAIVGESIDQYVHPKVSALLFKSFK